MLHLLNPVSFIRRHWRGELPLAVAWWINGVALTAGVLVLDRYAGSSDFESLIDSRPGLTAFLLLGMVLLLLVPGWQVVGIFRAADHHIAHVGTILAARVVQVLATLLTILLAMRFLVFFGENLPGARAAYASDYELRVLAGGRVVELRGGISYGLGDLLEQTLTRNPEVRRLRLNSGGGLLSEAIRVREVILARRLDTDSTEQCASACVSAYIAGRHRYLHRTARLGFHLPRNPGLGVHSPVSAAYGRELGYFLQRGVPRGFIARWINSGRRFWYPTPRQLRAAGIVQTFVGRPQQRSPPLPGTGPERGQP